MRVVEKRVDDRGLDAGAFSADGFGAGQNGAPGPFLFGLARGRLGRAPAFMAQIPGGRGGVRQSRRGRVRRGRGSDRRAGNWSGGAGKPA
ncbi:MAG: hypothetical protein QGI11_08105, partial [Nitrospinota bacterium]|nr:hypothetical protein [Nitrospinota bacterium]